MSNYDHLPTAAINEQIGQIENVIGQSSEPPPAKAAPEKSAAVSEEARRQELGKVFDAMQARGEQQEANAMPPPASKQSLEEAFDRTASWMEKSAADRHADSGAANEVSRLKERAAALGVELTDADALKLAFEIEQKQGGNSQGGIPSELAPTMQAVQQLYPDQAPHQIINRYAEIDRSFKSDPVGTIGWMAQQTGMPPLVLAQELALKYGNQEIVRQNAEHIVGQYFETNPDALKVQAAMMKAIEAGHVKRTGHIAGDLHRAYQFASKQQRRAGKRSTEAKLRDSMEIIYDRAKGRK